MKNFTYSVIIPAYNCEKTVETSILSAINQTYSPAQIIVVDDCSTDDTYDIIAQMQKNYPIIECIRQPINSGVANARNTGFLASSCDYAATLDSDDIWSEDKMKIQMEFMREQKCDFCCTAYSFISPDGTDMSGVYNVPEKILYDDMLVENYVGLSTLVVTKEIYKNYKMNEKYSHEDYAFIMTLLKDRKVGLGINLPLMRYRISPQSRSGNKKKAAIDRWIIYRDLLNMKIIPSIVAFVKYAYRGYKKYKNAKS